LECGQVKSGLGSRARNPCRRWSLQIYATCLLTFRAHHGTRRAAPLLAHDPGLLAPHRARLFQLLRPVTSYLVTNVTVTLFWVLFFVLNRTTVIGRRNVGEERNRR
jgi:hypothetical protein